MGNQDCQVERKGYRKDTSSFTSAVLPRPFAYILEKLEKTTLMPTLKLHYEGWVSLPAALRHRLGLNSGDRLEVDLVDGTIVLRPAAKAKRPVPREDQQAASDPPAPERPKRRHSRTPRRPDASQDDRGKAKLPTSSPRPHAEAPAWPAKGGSRAGARTSARACGQQRALEAAAQGGPATAGGERGACPAAEPPPRAASETGSPAEERRPFRNVEVRKLGPGVAATGLERFPRSTPGGLPADPAAKISLDRGRKADVEEDEVRGLETDQGVEHNPQLRPWRGVACVPSMIVSPFCWYQRSWPTSVKACLPMNWKV